MKKNFLSKQLAHCVPVKNLILIHNEDLHEEHSLVNIFQLLTLRRPIGRIRPEAMFFGEKILPLNRRDGFFENIAKDFHTEIHFIVFTVKIESRF